MSSSSANKQTQTFMETLKSNLSFQKIYKETKEYCLDFAKRRPIMATLLALELGSWAYLGLKRYSEKFIWGNTVLELQIKGDYTMKPKDPWDDILNPQSNKLSFLDLLHTIRGAAKDKRIRALLIRLDSEFQIGVGQCQELRDTLLQFKDTHNKPIIVYADNISQWGSNGVNHYYIASVASKIYMSDDGLVCLGPATIDYPFVNAGLKEKLDITVEVRRRAQYKSAGNMLARDEFDKFHKEQYTQLISHLEKNFVNTISEARLIKPYSIPKDPKVIQCIKWISEQIISENRDLEFSIENIDRGESKEKEKVLLSGIKEEKSDELEENYSGSDSQLEQEWNDGLMYLVHCWSWNGDYKNPILFVVLEFYDKTQKRSVFYKASVKHGTKRFGQLQRGANGVQSNSIKTDDKGNEISKELKYSLLPDFKVKESYIELVKPGDIDMPKADKKLDEDNGRGEIRDSLCEQHIIIRRTVNDILHHGAYTSKEAENIGLIDGISTYSNIYKKVMPELLSLNEKKISYLYLHRYYQRIYKSKLSKGITDIKNSAEGEPSVLSGIMGMFSSPVKIAYIGATNGQIIDGESSKDRIGSVTICRQLRAARKKKNIKGIILHLDTPGGSATACHNMCEEIKACINASKPVIAVQSNVAASGGYYLSAPCSYIIASPSTITGSIGIIGLKFTTKKFWKNKLGINYDRVTTHPLTASYFSQLDGFGEFERIRVEQALTNWYTRFKGVISEPRDMDLDKLETVCKGQVWLGTQALEIGLIDALGGLYEGMTKMKELLNIPSSKNIKLVNPLGKMTIWDILMGSTPENENDFSVPRNSLGGMLDLVCDFVRPMAWIKRSGMANLLVRNIVSSPMISSVMLMRNGLGMMNFGNGSRIVNDLQFMADEFRFYKNNQILMYEPALGYFQHNALKNGQI